MSMPEPFYKIIYSEGKDVFNEALSRFASFYGVKLADILVHAKCLRPAAFLSELKKYTLRYNKPLDDVDANDRSNGITLPADGRYVVLVKYEKDETDTAEEIREVTYHELGHAMSLYQTSQRYPDREDAFQNPKDRNTGILLNIGNFVWQEFIAKHLAAQLITADAQRMAFDKRNRSDIFVSLIERLQHSHDNCECYEKISDVITVALNSKIPFNDYIMPTDCHGIATRYTKTTSALIGAVTLACIMLWLFVVD